MILRFLILAFLACGIGHAEEEAGKLTASPLRTLIVFDASQSMYGKLAGAKDSKLKLAKAALLDSLESLPHDVEIGFLAFGHRGRSAPGGNRCGDIELLVPVGNNLAEVRRRVTTLSAKGTTPLCRALEQASKHLDSHASLILISDGGEGCGGDLLETARKIASSNDHLVVDILSLGQTKENNALLHELAKLTSGRLFDVQEEDQASKAMHTIMDSLTARGNLRITAHDLWETTTPTKADLLWKLYGVEGTPPLVAEFSGASLNLQVTPGLYWLVAETEAHHYAKQLHVPQQESISTRLSLSQGEIELQASGSWRFQLYRAWPGKGHEKHIVSKSNIIGPQVLKLPEGLYRLEYQRKDSALKHTRSLQAEPERRHLYKIAFPVKEKL